MSVALLLAAAGAASILLAVFMDHIGLGSDPETFGPTQILLLGVGLALCAAALAIRIGRKSWHISRSALANAGLVLGALAATYGTFEFFLFPRALHLVPIGHHYLIPENVRIFSQSSKRGAAPHDYVLVLGDSYAQGDGDWLWQAPHDRNAPFQATHVIHDLTGRDVVTFGQNGADNITSLVYLPQKFTAEIESTWPGKLPAPRSVLAYFYEGNDPSDNLGYLERHFDPAYQHARLRDEAYFDGFLDARRQSEPVRRQFRHRLPFTQFVMNMAGHIAHPPPAARPTLPPVAASAAALAGPDDPARVTDALYVFRQALRDARRRYADAEMTVVYIGAPATAYAQPLAAGHPLPQPEPAASSDIMRRSDALCSLVQAATESVGVALYDSRPRVRSAARNGAIHGPRDWGHFNKEGYTAFGEGIARYLRKELPAGCQNLR